MRPYFKKPFTKIGLVEWLKVKALSSSPNTTKQKKKKNLVVFRLLENFQGKEMEAGYSGPTCSPSYLGDEAGGLLEHMSSES
jgi:hypothetical protein